MKEAFSDKSPSLLLNERFNFGNLYDSEIPGRASFSPSRATDDKRFLLIAGSEDGMLDLKSFPLKTAIEFSLPDMFESWSSSDLFVASKFNGCELRAFGLGTVNGTLKGDDPEALVLLLKVCCKLLRRFLLAVNP
ncbi:hypothetical protein WICMUC_005895 [Wickerhamomyces mucosus]|uniref:Uncharacterized protein n=1 Tax=Wickerhamomyces mucosus TaxID=1378264 RepID=A0A9P8T3E0_9ASCO|nr:hypothetical protein WICMUC_005895 [Wickerhamomyces mucosus]